MDTAFMTWEGLRAERCTLPVHLAQPLLGGAQELKASNNSVSISI